MILLATLASRALPWSLDSIMAQEGDNVAVYKIKAPDQGHLHERIAAGRNEALWMFQQWPEFVEGTRYTPQIDALAFVDDDIILPERAIERLYEVPAPVVYPLSCRRYRRYHWSVSHDMQGNAPLHSYSQDRGWLELAQQKDVLPVTGGDFSVVLIRREALDGYTFEASRQHCADWYFARHCNLNGIQQVVRTSVVCGHILDNGSGKQAVWPSGTGHEIRSLA